MSEQSRRHPNVVNLSELEPMKREEGTRFALATKALGLSAGGSGIGCSWLEVPPGKTAFPMHFHCANEEAVFLLEGEGTLRIGEKTVPVRQGDYIALPTGPEHAHQLTNTGTGPLRYLAFSTMNRTEVVVYPDSNKVAAAATAPGKTFFDQPWIRSIFPMQSAVDYYDGEKVD